MLGLFEIIGSLETTYGCCETDGEADGALDMDGFTDTLGPRLGAKDGWLLGPHENVGAMLGFVDVVGIFEIEG